VKVDSRRWDAAIDFLAELYADHGYRASLQAAEEIQTITQAKLLALHHAPHTKTPSPKGSPPAAIGGDLAASIDVTGEPGSLSALVGPTASASSKKGPYGRFLELGGKHEGNMHWFEDGKWHKAKLLVKAERPYLKPSTEELIDSGRLTEIYVRQWEEAQVEATA
jgi:hypothetical protein